VEDRCQVRLVDGSGLLLKACNIELVSGNGFHMPDGGASKTSPDRPPTGSPKPDEAVKPPPTGSPKPDEAVKPRIAPNILVRIKGIKVRPELNGLQGVVTAWDPREESWAVRLHGAEASAQNLFGVVKNFREEDLEVPAGEAEPQPFVKAGLPLNSVVRILKLQKRPELNGQLGTVVGWDTVEDRCQVRLVDGSGLLLKACNIELVSGKGFHMPDEGATEPSTGSPKPDEAVKPLRPPPGLPKPDEAVKLPPTGSPKPDEAVKLPPTGSPKPDEAVKPLRPPTGSPKPDEAVKPPPTGSPKPDEAVKPPPTGSPKPDENRFGVKNSREEHFEAPAGEAEPQPLLKAGLPLNSVVRLLGLQKRPELNGQLGTVVGWDTVEDRCQVRLGDGSGLLLKACNMEPVPKDAWRRKTHPARVKTSSSQQQWQMNGLCGTNVEETIREPCYQLQPGSRIQVVDLKRQKERNGSKGSALEWVEQIERWKVVLDDGSSVLLRTNHLLPIGRGWDSSTAQTCE